MVVWRIVVFIFRFILVVSLPFVLLIRGAIYLHKSYATQPYVSILFGTIIMTFVLILYFSVIYGKLTGMRGKKGWLKRRAKFALLIAVVYVTQSIYFLSSKNAKSPEVKREYHNLQPHPKDECFNFHVIGPQSIDHGCQQKSGRLSAFRGCQQNHIHCTILNPLVMPTL